MTTQLIALDITFEKKYWKLGLTSIAGVDEVGRGSLAGPVVAAAVVFPKNHSPIGGIYDSKQLSSKRREMLDVLIRNQACAIGIGEVNATVIDTIGIIGATKIAMRQACEKILYDVILVDGPSKLDLNTLCEHTEAIIKGDQKIYSIAAASIVAKVYRDNLMVTLSKTHSEYAWDRNKGYGTKAHMDAIKKFGATGLHRMSFL